MLLRHVTHPARHCLHRTVLEGVVKDVLLHAGMGVRGGREGDYQKARGSNKRRGAEEEESSQAACVCKTSRMARKMAAAATAPGSG